MLNLLNIHYGVCFGFIFSLLFVHAGADSLVVDIRLFYLDKYISASFFIMLIYLFLDWSNAVRQGTTYRSELSWPYLVIYSLSIWTIGVICASVLGQHHFTLPILSIYATLVTFYCIFLINNTISQQIYGLGFQHVPIGQIMQSFALIPIVFLIFAGIYFYITTHVFGRQILADGQIIFGLSAALLANKVLRLFIYPKQTVAIEKAGTNE